MAPTIPLTATPPEIVPGEELVADELESMTFEANVVIHEALHLPLLRDGQ